MKNKLNIRAIMIIVFMLFQLNLICQVNEKVDMVKINAEIKDFYSMLEGNIEDKTVEQWDKYFFKSPNIGNIHNNNPAIGWQTFHDGIVKYFSRNPKGKMSITELKIHPINNKLIWVSALWTMEKPDGVITKSRFYDTLTKTDEKWSVIMSVVLSENN